LGWCAHHEKLVHTDKFDSQCRTASSGKRCRYFTYRIPGYINVRR